MKRKLQQVSLIFFGMAVSCGCVYAQTSSLVTRQLSDGWQFRSLHTPEPSERVDWHAAIVPGVVQADLLRYALIPDPSYGLNEKQYQWVGLSDWEYRTTFSLTRAEQVRKHVDLVFDGLDTFADVYLNGEQILQANNMFRQWRLPVANKLRPGENELRIVFHSPVASLLDKIKALPFRLPTVGQVQEVSEEGIATDPYTRKAPYQYGWDFNPRLLTEGIWQPIRLEAWNKLRIDDLHIHQRHISKDAAYFDTELSIEADRAGTAVVQISHRDAEASAPAGYSPILSALVQLHAGINHISLPGAIQSPRLWWPNGYGPQSMYQFKVIVGVHGDEAQTNRNVGFRSIELRRENDAWGKSFAFIVNGVPIFAKGASVVPIDVFPTRITRERLRQMLSAAREVNMNMVRVWGGGIYEPDAFYEICDRLGLMVWQDFMFGGAMVPNDPAFRENVRQEALYQVERLRDHPSIVLWCGNNETELKFYQPGITKHYNAAQQSDMRQGYLLTFSDAVKSVVTGMADPVPYWPSSPSANYDKPPSNSSDGDMHYWPVWYENLPAETYTRLFPRFMCEYGFESLPAMPTLRSFAPPDELKIDSATMTEHQKSNGARGNKVIGAAIQRDYGKAVDFPALVYLSQVEQADTVKVGAEDFRRLRPRTMGSLFWELQDGWPAIYSSSIDYYGRWKALQWYTKRFYSQLLISPWRHDGKIDVFAISDRQEAVEGTVRIRLMDFHGRILKERREPVNVPPLSSTPALTLDERQFLDGQDPRTVFALVEWIQGERVLSSNELFFLPVKDLLLPKAAIHWTLTTDGGRLQLSSDVLARDVSIEFQDPDARPSDNFFDLIPGKSVYISVQSKQPLRSLKPHVMSMTDALITQ